jgi:hypothetical protein
LADGKLPTCFVGLHGANASRDEFFQTISASLELKLTNQITVKPQSRIEQYAIIGPTRLELGITSIADGIMSSARISKTAPSLPYYGVPDR